MAQQPQVQIPIGTILNNLESALTNVSNQIGFHATANSVPLYYGDPAGCEEFVRCLDMAHSISHCDKSTVQTALLRSKSIVNETLQSYLQATPPAAVSWTNVKKILENQFGYPIDQKSALQTLRSTKQTGDMSVHHFAKLLALRAPKAFPSDDLQSPVIQKLIVEIFTSGLKSDFVKRKLVLSDPPNLESAVQLAYEQTLMSTRLQNFHLLPNQKQNCTTRQEIPMEVDLVEKSPQSPGTLPSFYTEPLYNVPCNQFETSDQVDPTFSFNDDSLHPTDGMNDYLEQEISNLPKQMISYQC